MRHKDKKRNMPKITIDDIEYNTEDLSKAGLEQLASLQFLDHQVQKLRNEMAVYQTARQSYVLALKAEIEKQGLAPVGADSSSADEQTP